MSTLMSKYWIGTSYRVDSTSAVLFSFLEVKALASYGCCQREICPKTQREHFQFFVAFRQRKRLTGVKKLFPGDHVEIARCPAQAVNYCKKLETRKPGTCPEEFGAWKIESSVGIMEQCKTRTLVELAMEHPWKVRQLKELKALVSPPREEMTTGVLLTGPTGTGKSKIAHLIGAFVGDSTYYADSSLQWFDGYGGEKLIIVDEYRGTVKPDFLLRLCDRYPMRLPYKGGFAQMGASMVIFTSNLTLEMMYPGLDRYTVAAIGRRINEYVVY